MQFFQTNKFLVLLAALSAMISFVSVQVGELGFLLFFAFIPLCFILNSTYSFLQKILSWFLFGILVYTFVFTFIYTAANNYFESSIIGIPVLFLYALYHSITFMVIAAVYEKIKFSRCTSWNPFILATVWVIVWSLIPSMIPINLSVTQTDYLIMIQGVDLFGPFGLDWLIVLVNAQLAWSVRSRKMSWGLWTVILLLISWLAYGIHTIGNYKNQQTVNEMTVGFIQPNFYPGQETFDSSQGNVPSKSKEFALSLQLKERNVDMVVWPEGHSYWYRSKEGREDIEQFVLSELKTPLMFSDYLYTTPEDKFQYENAYILLDDTGELKDKHVKSKGFPGAESLPFQESLYDVYQQLGMLHAGIVKTGNSNALFEVRGTTIVPILCYEIIQGRYIRNRMKELKGPGFAIVGSQLHWFDSDDQLRLQNNLTVLRAVENRTPILSAVYNGGSMFINALGEYEMLSTRNTEGAYVQNIKVKETMFSMYKTYPSTLINVFYFFLVFLILWRLFSEFHRNAKAAIKDKDYQ